jgi:hypothetical protein
MFTYVEYTMNIPLIQHIREFWMNAERELIGRKYGHGAY